MEGVVRGRRRSSRNVLPHYTIGRTLGIGTFGKVKLAVHTLTGIKVAIKILDRQSMNTSEAEKVRKEINIMRQLSHPRIVRLFEVIDTPAKVYVVMEYMNSGELFYYLTVRGKLPEDEARRLFQQIIAGVDYCHKHLVVHRDLKPENILLDSDHNVKIADFGLGNIMRDGHFLKTYCGSLNYAAPELLYRQLYAGPEVDVWSCGVILYALLCARLPFDDNNIPVLYAKIKSGVYPTPNHLTGNARDLIARMLVVDPMKRISIAEIQIQPWFQKNLPLYISSPSSNRQENFDLQVLRDMVQMGFDAGQVIGSLQSNLQNEATVAYSILVHRRAPDPASLEDENTGTHESMDVVGDTYTRAAPTVQDKWMLGFKSKASPRQTMRDVLMAFHRLNVRWKRIGDYNMKCLWSPPPLLPNYSVVAGGDAIKFETQVYRASGEFYVVDLQQVSGPPLLFLDICAAFRIMYGSK